MRKLNILLLLIMFPLGRVVYLLWLLFAPQGSPVTLPQLNHTVEAPLRTQPPLQTPVLETANPVDNFDVVPTAAMPVSPVDVAALNATLQVVGRRINSRFPTREATLPSWASSLMLHSSPSNCIRSPLRAVPSTRLTRGFTVDVPLPELAKLRDAICVRVHNPKKAFNDGATLFAFRYLPYIVILDIYGNIMATKTFDYLTTVVAPKWVNSTTISGILKRYGDAPAGWVASTEPCLWNVETGAFVVVRITPKPRGFLHHDMDFSTVSNTFLALHRYVTPKEQYGHHVLYDDILEIDLTGRVVWSWSGAQHHPFKAGEWVAEGKHPDSDCVDFRIPWCKDWMHGNTVFWDHEENCIYYNAKHTDSFWKIDKSTGEVLWVAGKYGGFKLIGADGLEKPALWHKSHGVERIGENRFLMFDNLYKDSTSRWLEVYVDEKRKVVREGRSWVAPRPRYAHQMADADRLPNGNTFLSITSTGELTEAHPDGSIAWEIALPQPGPGKGGKWWIYQAEKFTLVPTVDVRDINGSVARFTAWNTVRVRHYVNGELRLVRDLRQEIAMRRFKFRINWHPTSISLPLPAGSWKCGDNSLRAIVTNEDGISGHRDFIYKHSCP
eukprot:TRINITY_DN429_c0_g1_i1.p1 TRINITY_DN429_c0_g1~~TRINITY_DN429_c0_g1_i1.p1  ORF type:complete len:620 (-),score=73.41 TRINITY_DN429_c0_g1_i1:23-1852(-)